MKQGLAEDGAASSQRVVPHHVLTISAQLRLCSASRAWGRRSGVVHASTAVRAVVLSSEWRSEAARVGSGSCVCDTGTTVRATSRRGSSACSPLFRGLDGRCSPGGVAGRMGEAGGLSSW